MNSDKIISVITVCRNAEETIETTLRSVAAQENVAGQVEHIVIDGASQDGTLDIVKQFPATRWVSEPDDGISDAFNKGWRFAKGEYVLYLNADDYLYDSTVLSDSLDFINDNHHPDWIVGDVLVCENDEISVPPRGYPPSCWSLIFRNRICHQSVFLKRRAFEEIGDFSNDFEMTMDYDLWQRLCSSGYDLVYFPRIVAVYSKEGLTSGAPPAMLREHREVALRFRDNPIKRIIGTVYDTLKG
jgi:glycosyltransferase involved in cell wall biosynthesis